MRKLIIIFFLFNIAIFAQPFQHLQKISTLSTTASGDTPFTYSLSPKLDSILLIISDGVIPITIDSLTGTSNITFPSNTQLLADSNRFYTTSNGWIITGDGDTTISTSDSSMVYSTVPIELNPNPTFSDWSYTNLTSGTLTTSSVYQIVTYVAGDDFTNLSATNVTGNIFVASGTTPTTWTNGSTLRKLVAPDGWTASTMNATNYVIQDDDGLRLVSDGASTYILSNIGAEGGKFYEINLGISENTGSDIYYRFGTNGTIYKNTSSSSRVVLNDATSNENQIWIVRVGATNTVVSELSITEYHESSDLSLPVPTTLNQGHVFSFTVDSVLNSATLSAYYGNSLLGTTDTITSTETTYTFPFISNGSDTLKLVLSDTAKVKLSDVSFVRDYDYDRINYGDSLYKWYYADISVIGDYTEKIYVHSNKQDSVDINYSVVEGYNLIAETPIDFNTVTATTPITAYATLKNHSGGTITFSGSSGLEFPFYANALPSSLANGDSVEFGVTLFPSLNGTFLDTVFIAHSGVEGLDSIIVNAVVNVTTENQLLAPQSLTASMDDGGILISWVDINVPDTIESFSYDFNSAEELDNFTATYSASLSIESEKLKVTDIGAGQYPGAKFYLDIEPTKSYKITVDGEVGTASKVGFWVTDSATTPNPGYYNNNFSVDTNFSVLVESSSYDKLLVQLQGYTPSGGYFYHDNLSIMETEASYDGYEIYIQEYYNNTPNSDWYLLYTSVGEASNYLHASITDGSKYGYKVRYYKLFGVDTLFSDYSNTDTLTYVLSGNVYESLSADVPTGSYDYLVIVDLETSLAGSKIYYTLDGSTPTTSSTQYYKPILIDNSSTSSIVKTLKAVAVRGDSTTDILTETYTLGGKYTTTTIATGTTYLEVEGTYYTEGEVVYGKDDFASNNAYAVTVGDIGSESDVATIIKVAPSTTGTYYFWARVGTFGGNNQAELAISENGGAYSADQWTGYVIGDSAQWKGYGLYWVMMEARTLTSGSTYSYKLLNRYGNSYSSVFDKVCFTTNSSYIPPDYLITSPDGGERWYPDSTAIITWINNNENAGNVKLEYTDDDGATWTEIISSTSNDGSYAWGTPTDTGETYRIRITDVDSSNAFMESYNNFYITNNMNPYSDTLTYHNYVGLGIPSGETDANLYANGGEQFPIAVNAHFNTGGYDDEGNWANIPDTSAIDTFLVNNNNVTLTLNYCNMQTMSSASLGEGVMPQIDHIDNWAMMAYPSTGTVADTTWYSRIESGPPGRAGIYFWDYSYLNRLWERIQIYQGAGLRGFYWDSYEPLARQNYENDNWDDRSARILNRSTNTYFTYSEYTNGFKFAAYEIKRKVDSLYTDAEQQIWANGHERFNLMNAYRYIDGVIAEGWCGTSTPTTKPSTYHTREYMEVGLENMKIWQRKGLGASLTVANYTDYQTEAIARTHKIGCWLLGLTKPDQNTYLRSAYLDFEDWQGMDNLQMKRFVPLSSYTEVAKDVYKREFQYATVYVNNRTTAYNVSFSASYYMDDTGTWEGAGAATSYNMPALSGLIVSTLSVVP